MDAQQRHALEHELHKHTCAIKAAEDWAPDYRKDDASFTMLIKAEAKLERELTKYYKDLSERAPAFVIWSYYNYKLLPVLAANDPFDVNVMVSDDLFDAEDGIVMKVIFNPVAETIVAGALAGESIYGRPVGYSSTSAAIQEATRTRVANLVGKRIDKSGNIIDNPRAKYRITETVRNDIRQSIRTSLNLGETQEEATARLTKTVKNPARAARIASTEAVNGYQGGLALYASDTGAVGKEWQTIGGACAICTGNEADGVIPINQSFSSGDDEPSAHPWDRCTLRYVYAEELNN